MTKNKKPLSFHLMLRLKKSLLLLSKGNNQYSSNQSEKKMCKHCQKTIILSLLLWQIDKCNPVTLTRCNQQRIAWRSPPKKLSLRLLSQVLPLKLGSHAPLNSDKHSLPLMSNLSRWHRNKTIELGEATSSKLQ